MRATVVLKPSESKRLIAKAVASLPTVQEALREAFVVICEGSTNTLVAEEILGKKFKSEHFTSGISIGGTLCLADKDARGKFPLVLDKGDLSPLTMLEALERFHPKTVIIKGGNAIDPQRLVGVIVSGFDGGSVAKMMGTIVSQGLRLICPIGLEKMVVSVTDAARHAGGKRFDYSMGPDYGIYIVSHAEVVTEIDALAVLSGAKSVHVASGGIGGNEGAVILAIEGDQDQVDRAIQSVCSVKGEPAQQGIRATCVGCKYVKCAFFDKTKEELPSWIV